MARHKIYLPVDVLECERVADLMDKGYPMRAAYKVVRGYNVDMTPGKVGSIVSLRHIRKLDFTNGPTLPTKYDAARLAAVIDPRLTEMLGCRDLRKAKGRWESPSYKPPFIHKLITVQVNRHLEGVGLQPIAFPSLVKASLWPKGWQHIDLRDLLPVSMRRENFTLPIMKIP